MKRPPSADDSPEKIAEYMNISSDVDELSSCATKGFLVSGAVGAGASLTTYLLMKNRTQTRLSKRFTIGVVGLISGLTALKYQILEGCATQLLSKPHSLLGQRGRLYMKKGAPEHPFIKQYETQHGAIIAEDNINIIDEPIIQ
jgi:hypothetical protein